MTSSPPPVNRLNRVVARVDRVPAALRPRLLSLVMGRTVPFVGTAGVRFEAMTAERVAVSLPNQPRVRNHIGQLHAVAMTLLAETASGMVVAMNVPDTTVPVIKSMRVDFRKRSKGAMRAVATLTAEQLAALRGTEKGEVAVAVQVTDESGGEPITCEMIWAWVPRRR